MAVFNRIAVVLIGHSRLLGEDIFRNQYQLHKRFIDSFNKMSHQVDYYILSWKNIDYNSKTPTSKTFEILWPNRCFYKLYDENTLDFNKGNKIMKLCWLAKKAAEQIKIVQDNQNFNYDYVIESRLDQYIIMNDKNIYIELKDNELLADVQKGPIPNTKTVYKQKNWNPNLDSVETFAFSNWYFRMNPKTYFEFSNRFDFFWQKTPQIGFRYHRDLAYYFLKNKKFVFAPHNKLDYLTCEVISKGTKYVERFIVP